MNTTISFIHVREQLQKLLDCEQLRAANVLSRFLEFIVTEKLENNEHEIKEYTIGVKALGRSADFNPQTDVGGGIISVIPGRYGIAVFAPPLDKAGNSVKAQLAIEYIAKKLNGDVYAIK